MSHGTYIPSTNPRPYTASYSYSSSHGKTETAPQNLHTDYHVKPTSHGFESSTFGFGSPTSTSSTVSNSSHFSTGGYTHNNNTSGTSSHSESPKKSGYGYSGVSATSGYGTSEALKKSGYVYTAPSGHETSDAFKKSGYGYSVSSGYETSSHGVSESPKKSGYGYSGASVTPVYGTSAPSVYGTVHVTSEAPKKSYGYSGTSTYGYGLSEAPKKSEYGFSGTSTYGTSGTGISGNAGYGNSGSYGYTSSTTYNANPTPSTQYGVTSFRPSSATYGTNYGTNVAVSSYGTSTGAPSYGTNTGTSSYGTSSATPSYGTNYGTTSNYGGYSYGGSTTPYNPTPSQPQQQSYSYDKSPYSAPTQSFASSYSNNSSSKFSDTINSLRSSGQKYRDSEFPPEIRSLTGGLSDYELAQSGNDLDWRGLVWRRAEEIYGKNNFQVFQGKIEPNDITQGALGDCYFLSTLASLAENPDRIKKIFESATPNEQGCYAVRICDMGIWQTVILDDFLPCNPSSKKPAFTTGNGNEIWVQLLEKAWAKMYGSYARIEAGLTRECLHDLTGAPTKYYLTSHEDKHEEIWHAISHGEKKNYAMTCGSGDFFEGADLMSSIGLVGSHAYSLLAAVEVTDRYGRKVRLVKLRNPWGKGEWTGDWSDKSPLWTEDLKRQVQFENKEDGIFYMSYQEMLKYYSDIQICKIHDDYKYKAIKSTCDSRHAVYFKINVRTPGHYFITLNQESTRKHRESEGYKYSSANLVLGKKTQNGYKYIEGYQRADKEVWTDGHLDAGEYIVYAKVAWNDRRPKEFSISSYGQGDVDIEQISKSHCPGFLEGVYLDKGRQAKKLQSYQDLGVTNCFRAYELTDDGFAYIYYKNQSNRTLEEELSFQAQGIKLKKPFRGGTAKVVVPPGQEKVVVAKTNDSLAFRERAKFI